MSNKDYERGFIDGMQEQLKRIVDKSVNGLDACASECLGLRSTVNEQHRIIMGLQSKGHRLALELECLLLDTKDTAIQSKWWDSAHEALEEWRK